MPAALAPCYQAIIDLFFFFFFFPSTATKRPRPMQARRVWHEKSSLHGILGCPLARRRFKLLPVGLVDVSYLGVERVDRCAIPQRLAVIRAVVPRWCAMVACHYARFADRLARRARAASRRGSCRRHSVTAWQLSSSARDAGRYWREQRACRQAGGARHSRHRFERRLQPPADGDRDRQRRRDVRALLMPPSAADDEQRQTRLARVPLAANE